MQNQNFMLSVQCEHTYENAMEGYDYYCMRIGNFKQTNAFE